MTLNSEKRQLQITESKTQMKHNLRTKSSMLAM